LDPQPGESRKGKWGHDIHAARQQLLARKAAGGECEGKAMYEEGDSDASGMELPLHPAKKEECNADVMVEGGRGAAVKEWLGGLLLGGRRGRHQSGSSPHECG
jgi:hypothetical protein